MWRHPFKVAVILVLAALATLAAPAPAERARVGKVLVSLDGDFSPHALPRSREVPITVRFDGAIATTDGSHPPALRRLEIALNRNGAYSAAGLPRCRSGVLQSTTSRAALRRCRRALVGKGNFRAAIESEPAAVPVRGRLLVFNSRRRGRPALLLHLNASVPIQATFVTVLQLRQRPRGTYGTVLATRLPRLAGGLGSITDVHLRIGRTHRHRGQRRSLIAASCAAPPGFSIALFPFARARFRFADGKRLEVPLTRSCRVR